MSEYMSSSLIYATGIYLLLKFVRFQALLYITHQSDEKYYTFIRVSTPG